jgi:CBS domain-containing protein
LLEEQQVSQLPMVAEGRLVAVINDRDLRDTSTGGGLARNMPLGTLRLP